MTFSDAWIEAGNDEEFAAFLARSPRFSVLPPPERPYWINRVQEWAQLEGLPIEHPDYNVIRVPVTKDQLLRFMTEMLGDAATPVDPSTLRGYVQVKCRVDRTYAIAADEF